jgi:hypothetical protein
VSALGELGVIHDEPTNDETEPDTFQWFGADIRVLSDVDEIELVEIMASFRAVKTNDLTALGVVKESLQVLVHPDDWEQFWTLARARRQKVEDLMTLFHTLLFRPTDRPTMQPSDSSAGRLAIDGNSPADSPSPASDGPEKPARPDIQAIHDDMEEFRLRKAAVLSA